ncbi:hypothetical protein SAMN05444281_2227 [Wenyingzhuangia marina]|uniref:Uncharacterized protein n=2 Tax=Wenyingzhuangia marina TaxID=1195760 RepID=A0A1M5W586_9FLAO|nr:hypothetical protein GCM10011397_18430 [Wenyingzhuangia marina]SHH82598.1 hypothetical protein SAMN05444281_2227 [Wenyingzhuangia marina]
MKNYMKKSGIHILALTALCVSTVSCSESFDTSFFDKEIEEPTFDISISGLPIGYINYTANQLFQELNEDLTVNTGTDDIISFSYSQTLDGSGNSDFVSVEDQVFNGNFNLLEDSGLIGQAPYISGLVPDDKVEDSFKEIQTLNLDSDLTAADFSSGTFTITLSTTTEAQTEIIFTIPSFKRKDPNEPGLIENPEYPGSYCRKFTLNNNSGSDEFTISVDLNRYDFDFTYTNIENDPDTKGGFNNIAVQLDATVTFETGDLVSSDDKLTYTIALESPIVNTAEGDFKKSGFNVGGQSFDLDFFNEIGNGSLIFESPILKLTATNQYGFPIGINLEGISTDAVNNNTLIITDTSGNNIESNNDTGNGTYAIIDAGLNTGGVESVITLNSSNSNLAQLLGEKPSQFILNVSGTSNPNSTGTNNNFFNINNSLDVSVDVELPLHVTFDDVTFNPDPIELDLDDDIQDNAKELSLRIATKNTIPFNGSIILDFVDENGASLFTKNIEAIVAAPVDANGFSTYTLDADNNLKDANNNTVNAHVPMNGNDFAITFNESEINSLEDAKEVKLSIIFDTDTTNDGNPNPVKVKSTDQVRIDLALKGDLAINPNN